MKKHILLAYGTLLSFCFLAAQTGHDSAYYQSYKGSIITRVYFSRKYDIFKLTPHDPSLPAMSYHANTTLSLGLGLTYRSLSFSFSKELSFLKSQERKGATNATDLQLHLYKQKWTIDAVGEFYKGYYLRPDGLAAPDGQSFYLRPDLGVQLVGLAAYRVLNDQRFSYGAGLSQNAWQKKSAGSFLVGGEAFYLATNADSSFVPATVDSAFASQNVRKLHLFEIGPGVGYAYTLVIREYFFLLGSVNVDFNLHFARELGNDISSDKIGFTPNFIFRVGAGYNLSRWGLNLTWMWSSVNATGGFSNYKYNVTAGNYRLIYFRRVAINRRMKRILRPTD
ncbi:MAG TPA: DUF4421 family protein [Puia sp.]|nr:DUF4421 family protein [Puia sp.]